MISRALSACLFGTACLSADTILHYRVFDSDAATVAGGTVPGVDGSDGGEVFNGQVTLSEDIPTEGIPLDAGNRSLSFDGTAGVNLPGTQQLLNSDIAAAGGFTYEAWFTYSGGGNINSIIDYAGTEKLVRQASSDGAGYRNNSAAPLYALGPTGLDEWHYAAVVFESTELVGTSVTGNFTFYFDSTEPVDRIEGVTISDFGDSLNRTISVGAHPLGFGGNYYNGLIFEPRVSLAALQPGDLLYGSQDSDLQPTITGLELVDGGNLLTWTSIGGQTYDIEYSMDLENWSPAGTASAEGETTEFLHELSPDFEELIGAPTLFYRVALQD